MPGLGQTQGGDEVAHQRLIAQGLIAHQRTCGDLVNGQLPRHTLDERSLTHDDRHAMPPHSVANVRLSHGACHRRQFARTLRLFDDHDRARFGVGAGDGLSLRTQPGGTHARFEPSHRGAHSRTVAIYALENNGRPRARNDRVESSQDVRNGTAERRSRFVGIAEQHHGNIARRCCGQKSDGSGRQFLCVINDNQSTLAKCHPVGYRDSGLAHDFGGVGKSVSHGIEDIGE